MSTVGVFYSSDGNIRCLCVDQSGRKINEVGEEAQENHIVCVDREDNHSRCVGNRFTQ